VLRAALQHGDRVLVPVPCWPSYFDLCAAAGVVGAAFETEPAADFALDLDRLAAEAEAQDAKAVMLSNPCNPTGRILRAREVEGLAEICRARGMLLIVDQSFSGVIFDAAGWARSVAPAFDRLVLVDSFSKNYLLQGARVAAVAAPSWLVESAATVHQTIVSAAPTPGQKPSPACAEDERRNAKPRRAARHGGRVHRAPRLAAPRSGRHILFLSRSGGYRRLHPTRAAARNVFLLSGEAFGPTLRNHFRFCFCKPEEELAAILNLLDEPPNDA
jgi:aspartate/methionine/tyrosine aminotransferase